MSDEMRWFLAGAVTAVLALPWVIVAASVLVDRAHRGRWRRG